MIEAQATQSQHSKALAIFPRTMEIFDMAGVVAPFLEQANRVTSVCVVSHGHDLAHMHFEPHESVYAFVAMVPQDATEKILVEQLRAKGRDVEYETSFVTAIPRQDSVVATIDHQGQCHEVNAAFVVGCDGAHSAVRHTLNLPFEGAEYETLSLLAHVQTNDMLPASECSYVPANSVRFSHERHATSDRGNH